MALTYSRPFDCQYFLTTTKWLSLKIISHGQMALAKNNQPTPNGLQLKIINRKNNTSATFLTYANRPR